jgi:2-polyprenyl-6-methoxyphenol hydroxylase-like FAD-dependent oxidoreductase
MLLAQQGHRVLLVDRARFPSDTLSTHYIWPPGIACLQRWGLLDRVAASNCPPIRTIGLDLGDFQLVGELPPFEGVAECLVPRRTLLDKLLIDAAAQAGAEVREEFSVTGLTASDGRVTGIRGHYRGGPDADEQARIVIGADGRDSLIAKTVQAEEYNVRPMLTCGYYAYWSDVPPHLTAIHPRARRTVISFPTNDGLTITYVACPRDEFEAVRANPSRHIADSLGLVADFEELFRAGRRVEQVRGTGTLPNFFRKAHGNGWALVGDAGYHKDPILGQGISDALRSAEWLADAVHAGLSGSQKMDEALAGYQRIRDEHFMPMYDFNCNQASLEPPPAEMIALFGALRHNPAERNRFFGTLGNMVPIQEYYHPENLRRIIGGEA